MDDARPVVADSGDNDKLIHRWLRAWRKVAQRVFMAGV
jgi:hypothetical protein